MEERLQVGDDGDGERVVTVGNEKIKEKTKKEKKKKVPEKDQEKKSKKKQGKNDESGQEEFDKTLSAYISAQYSNGNKSLSEKTAEEFTQPDINDACHTTSVTERKEKILSEKAENDMMHDENAEDEGSIPHAPMRLLHLFSPDGRGLNPRDERIKSFGLKLRKWE